MNDRLIVALDGLPIKMLGLVDELSYAGVTFFKVGTSALLDQHGHTLLQRIGLNRGLSLMLDLKVYDTRDTVDRVVKTAFDVGARFVTVHATPSIMAAAMRAKGAEMRVLAVPMLTDQIAGFEPIEHDYLLNYCDGVVCSPVSVARWRARLGKVLVCPGIRPVDHTGDYVSRDNHVLVRSPREAMSAGADYIVVGRPIWAADDPVAAAKAILAEMS